MVAILKNSAVCATKFITVKKPNVTLRIGEAVFSLS
jgi:hypothetical protein